MRCFRALAAIQHVPQDKKNNNNPTMFYIQQNASFWLMIIIKPERERKWTERPIYSEKKKIILMIILRKTLNFPNNRKCLFSFPKSNSVNYSVCLTGGVDEEAQLCSLQWIWLHSTVCNREKTTDTAPTPVRRTDHVALVACTAPSSVPIVKLAVHCQATRAGNATRVV